MKCVVAVPLGVLTIEIGGFAIEEFVFCWVYFSD